MKQCLQCHNICAVLKKDFVSFQRTDITAKNKVFWNNYSTSKSS